MIASIIDLPPEIQLIIQRKYYLLLWKQKFKSVRSVISTKLYFWMHKEGMYNIDSRSLPYMRFSQFHPRVTPVGILRLPRAAHIILPNTFLLLI